MWFLQRLGLSGAGGTNAPSYLTVLTPDNIPEFCIPPRRSVSPGCQAVPRRGLLQVEGAGLCLGNEEEVKEASITSADLVPLHANSPEIIYLPESPHTRRKESLFHEAWPWAYSGLPGLTPGPWALDSDTASSADSSPFGSPLPPRVRGQRPAHHLEPPVGMAEFGLRPRAAAKESALALEGRGALILEAGYRSEDGRLHLRLVRVRGLYPPPFQLRDIACCVSLCLLPGKTQKQRSAVIRRSRDPVLNEDFFFEGLSQDDLSHRELRVKVLNRGSGVRRDSVMGRCRVQLASVLPAARNLSKG